MVRLELVLEQALELVRIEVAADDQAQAVGDELDHVVIGEDARIFVEQLALLGRFDIRLDGEHAGLADLHQDVVEQLQQIQVILALVARALEQPEGGGEGALHHLDRIAGNEGAECGAEDDDEFARMPQQQQVAALHEEAAEDA